MVLATLGAQLLVSSSGGSGGGHLQLVRPSAALVEQGRYLATAGDCISCHTRTRGKPFSGGVPLNTPFGVIYSANITPDARDGIGAWSMLQFARAMREGIVAAAAELVFKSGARETSLDDVRHHVGASKS